MGANNVKWPYGASQAELADPTLRIKRLRAEFDADYLQELERLIGAASHKPEPSAIVAYGIVDFKSAIEAHGEAVAIHKRKPVLYPYALAAENKRFPAIKAENAEVTIAFQQTLNRDLVKMVRHLQTALKAHPQVRLYYSDVLAKQQIVLEDLNAIDSFH